MLREVRYFISINTTVYTCTIVCLAEICTTWSLIEFCDIQTNWLINGKSVSVFLINYFIPFSLYSCNWIKKNYNKYNTNLIKESDEL